ncbi:MAG: hypothetical protein IH945_05070 [Armatimonadetes bacterium]|nr:hypothetical protein [Armatimonadota bacterium]
MVKCVCGKEIENAPTWLGGVNVTFICNNCPSRDVKGITQVDFSTPQSEEEKAAEAAEAQKAAEAKKKGG